MPQPIEALNLKEHVPLRDVVLSQSAARALAGIGAVDLTPSATSDGWTLRAKQFVGVIHTQGLELRIHPKVPVGNLLFMLAYAKDQRGWHDLVTTLDSSRDLVTAIAMGFVHHTTQALQQGVIQGYVSRDESLNVVRGRIRTADQLTRRHGLPLPLEVTYDEFTPDVTENQILRSALHRVTSMPAIPAQTVRRARHLFAQLEGVTLVPAVGYIPEVHFNRLNERYRSAVTLGNLILRAQSLMFSDGTTATTGFLFDMNRVFEDFVSAALLPLFKGSSTSLATQKRDHLDNAGVIRILPDLTWWQGGTCVGVADVKYKSLATKELPNADVYQALAYCIAHQLSRGHLIYAAGNEPEATHNIRYLDVTLQVHALDLSMKPPIVLEGVKALYRRLLSPTDGPAPPLVVSHALHEP